MWSQEGSVTALGHIEDMVSLLHSVEIAVLASYREGMPKSLLEAAACELAIVATDAPGCREAVKHGVSGLIVPCRDPDALAEAIRYLAEHPEVRAQMGRAGRTKVLREFDERIITASTINLYDELMCN